MKMINFCKLTGCGNDFIVIDNKKDAISQLNLKLNLHEFIKKICKRSLSVGADGFVLIENSKKADFKWRFYNSDGSLAEMCGNAARCVAKYALIKGIAESKMSIETDVGIIYAEVIKDNVKVNMPDPVDLKINYPILVNDQKIIVSSINTGVPHVVIFVDNINKACVLKTGKVIRYNEIFSPQGTNVNFIEFNKNNLKVRTYERGVENETLACGTGVIAAAIISNAIFKCKSPIKAQTKSGENLLVHYKNKNNKYHDIFLQGNARIIYEGNLYEDAWSYNLNE